MQMMRIISSMKNNERNSVINSIKNTKRNELSNKAKILYNMIIRKNITSIRKELERRNNILNKITAAQRRLRNLRNNAKYVVHPNGTINLATTRHNANRKRIQSEINSLMRML